MNFDTNDRLLSRGVSAPMLHTYIASQSFSTPEPDTLPCDIERSLSQKFLHVILSVLFPQKPPSVRFDVAHPAHPFAYVPSFGDALSASLPRTPEPVLFHVILSVLFPRKPPSIRFDVAHAAQPFAYVALAMPLHQPCHDVRKTCPSRTPSLLHTEDEGDW